MAQKNDLRIWWLDQEDCQAIGPKLPDHFPPHLVGQYESRLGRPGRGRLWVDPSFGDVKTEVWPDTPLGRRLQDCAGIVCLFGDLVLLHNMPGIVTDLQVNRADFVQREWIDPGSFGEEAEGL